MQDPFKLSLHDLGGLTDDQIVALFTERKRRRPNSRVTEAAKERLKRYTKESFKDSFVNDYCRGDEGKREKALDIFKKNFPDYKDN
jgi:hypothetical protein